MEHTNMVTSPTGQIATPYRHTFWVNCYTFWVISPHIKFRLLYICINDYSFSSLFLLEDVGSWKGLWLICCCYCVCCVVYLEWSGINLEQAFRSWLALFIPAAYCSHSWNSWPCSCWKLFFWMCFNFFSEISWTSMPVVRASLCRCWIST